ncbi:unnamed protein product [Symbiodinium sp. CCMP2456]|nr:unnamed protein product [Symbiodinium sp. CCMP2456]
MRGSHRASSHSVVSVGPPKNKCSRIQVFITSKAAAVIFWVLTIAHCAIYMLGPGMFRQLLDFVIWVWVTGGPLAIMTVTEVAVRVSAQGGPLWRWRSWRKVMIPLYHQLEALVLALMAYRGGMGIYLLKLALEAQGNLPAMVSDQDKATVLVLCAYRALRTWGDLHGVSVHQTLQQRRLRAKLNKLWMDEYQQKLQEHRARLVVKIQRMVDRKVPQLLFLLASLIYCGAEVFDFVRTSQVLGYVLLVAFGCEFLIRTKAQGGEIFFRPLFNKLEFFVLTAGAWCLFYASWYTQYLASSRAEAAAVAAATAVLLLLHRCIRLLGIQLKVSASEFDADSVMSAKAMQIFMAKFGTLVDVPPTNVKVDLPNSMIHIQKASLKPEAFAQLHLPVTVTGGLIEDLFIDFFSSDTTKVTKLLREGTQQFHSRTKARNWGAVHRGEDFADQAQAAMEECLRSLQGAQHLPANLVEDLSVVTQLCEAASAAHDEAWGAHNEDEENLRRAAEYCSPQNKRRRHEADVIAHGGGPSSQPEYNPAAADQQQERPLKALAKLRRLAPFLHGQLHEWAQQAIGELTQWSTQFWGTPVELVDEEDDLVNHNQLDYLNHLDYHTDPSLNQTSQNYPHDLYDQLDYPHNLDYLADLHNRLGYPHRRRTHTTKKGNTRTVDFRDYLTRVTCLDLLDYLNDPNDLDHQLPPWHRNCRRSTRTTRKGNTRTVDPRDYLTNVTYLDLLDYHNDPYDLDHRLLPWLCNQSYLGRWNCYTDPRPACSTCYNRPTPLGGEPRALREPGERRLPVHKGYPLRKRSQPRGHTKTTKENPLKETSNTATMRGTRNSHLRSLKLPGTRAQTRSRGTLDSGHHNKKKND